MTLIKRNIAASYVGQLYVTLMGIVLVPLYLKFMGAEAYGLVGFYAVLQSWFMLLDFGLTPTVSREAARFRGNAIDAAELRGLLRAFEGVFFATALLGAIVIAASSNLIANRWLNAQQLPAGEIERALQLVAAIVALRWVSDLYRGVITGMERLVWLNGFNIVIATLRFAFVVPFLKYVGARPTDFFRYQLAVAIIEIVAVMFETYRHLPKAKERREFAVRWQRVRSVLHFSLSVAAAGVLWIIATQTDKLILSKLLPLSQYGYFTLAVLVASGVLIMSVPISGPLLPRLVALNAEGNDTDLVRIYRNATQLVAVVAVPTTAILAVFSRQVLWVWTGDQNIATSVSSVLTLYALGNGVLALGAFPYYLQFAKGNLNLHLIGNGLFTIALVPLVVWATLRYGVVGAGYAWLGTNTAYFIFWIPVVHHRFAKGLQKPWLLNDLAAIVLVTAFFATMARLWVKWPANRESAAMLLVLISITLLIIAGAASSTMRETFRNRLRTRALQGSL